MSAKGKPGNGWLDRPAVRCIMNGAMGPRWARCFVGPDTDRGYGRGGSVQFCGPIQCGMEKCRPPCLCSDPAEPVEFLLLLSPPAPSSARGHRDRVRLLPNRG